MRRTYAVGRVSPFALVVALAGCTSNPGTANPDERGGGGGRGVGGARRITHPLVEAVIAE